jgi:two-component system, NarL family, invasion response regulator UvrY
VIRILIADDHPVVRRGLVEHLSEAFPDSTFGEAPNAQELLAMIRRQDWELLMLDIEMRPGRSGLDVLREIKGLRPKMPVLVLSVHPEDQYATRVLKAGAAGYLTKDSAPLELVNAARKVLRGGRYVSSTLAEKLALEVTEPFGRPVHETLSDREMEVLRMIASGKTVSQISEELSLSPKTVSTYRARLMEKMKMATNAQLIHYAVKNQLVD